MASLKISSLGLGYLRLIQRTVYLTIRNQNDSSILQKDLSALQEWEPTWDMEVNPSECQVLHINRATAYPFSVYPPRWDTDCDKYIGVKISKDLTWNTHISEITGKTNRTLAFVKRNIRSKTKTKQKQSVKELAYKP